MTLLALMASFETAFAQPHAPSERSVPDARIDGLLRRGDPAGARPDELSVRAVSQSEEVRPDALVGAASRATAQSTVIPWNPRRSVTFKAPAGDVGITLPESSALGEGRVLDGTRVVFRSQDKDEVFTVESVEGATRIHHVIGSPSAPHEAAYQIELPDEATHEQYDDGSIVFRDPKGVMIAGIAPPWASDATGRRIPTEFIFEDSTLTQRVDVEGLDVSYPLVADPFMGKMLFHKFNASKWFRGERVYSGTKTAWGQAIHNGSAGDPSGWIGGVVAGQSIMRNEGWAEWKGVFGKAVTSKATMYQQYSCHVLGGFYDWAGDWNLERARTDNPNWWATVAFHLCNW